MAGWGKDLYVPLPFRAPGVPLTFDIRAMSHLWERFGHPREMQVIKERRKSIQPRSAYT